ncbi:MAG: hypothetical protein K6E91_01105 [Butyrivibrio sp.]|nr:hypothetical protein [Butyrivibrio sp.]
MIMQSEYSLTIVINLMALLIVFGLWITPTGNAKKGSTETGLFAVMGISIVFGALCSMVRHIMPYTFYGRGMTVTLISITVAELSTISFLYGLLLYSDFRLFGSRDHLLRHYRKYLIPVYLLVFVYLINLFTGILFAVEEDNFWTPTELYFFVKLFQYAYLILPAVNLVGYYFGNDVKAFLHPFSIYFPIIGGALFTGLTPCFATFLGYAVGLTFSVFAGIDEWRFVDSGTKFYNRAYLEYLVNRIREGKEKLTGMIEFEAKGHRGAFVHILKEDLPADSIVVALGEGRYLFLADRAGAYLELLDELVKESALAYDNENSGKKIKPESRITASLEKEEMTAALEAFCR